MTLAERYRKAMENLKKRGIVGIYDQVNPLDPQGRTYNQICRDLSKKVKKDQK